MPDIHASINKAVVKTVKVRYSLEPSQNIEGLWQWFIAYHVNDETGEEPYTWAGNKDDDGNGTRRYFFVKKWNKVGRHMVRCAKRRTTSEGKSTKEIIDTAEHEQIVVDEGEFLKEQMKRSKNSSKVQDPYYELTMTWKWLTLLDGMAQVPGALANETIKKEHEARVKELENYAEKLKAILEKCNPDVIWPFRAVYLAEESMEEQDLRVFVTQPKDKKDRLMIVDWTNPSEPKMYGTYEGRFPDSWKGKNTAAMIQAGFKNAINEWQSENKYWVGAIRYEFNVKFGENHTVNETGTIKTGETGFTDTLIVYLKKIAMGAALIGLVLTGVGSAWAGAFIVTSMVASGTGSVLSIHRRHAKGSGDFMDDAMDVLDVISSVLGLGGKAGKAAIMWRKGAILELSVAGKTVKAMFIGQVYVDGFAGLLIGVQFIDRYDKIMTGIMTPDDRAKELLDLFAEAAGQGLLHGLNNKITSSIEDAKWRELAVETSDGVPIHIDDTPTMKGHTDDGAKDVTVVSKQKRLDTPNVNSKPKAKPFPPKDDTIWRRNEIDDTSITLETKDGFKFSAGIDKRGYVGVDIKTRKTAAEAKADGSGETSSHLGSGRENFDRMFEHFESTGHEIKGWSGMFVDDNLKSVRDAMAGGASAKEAVLQSITGKKFWAPWAKSKGLKIVVEHASMAGQDTFVFSVKFEK